MPAGYRLALTVRGKDYVYPGGSGGRQSNFKNEMTGCGPFLHDDPHDRPPEIFGGVTGLHFGGATRPYLLPAHYSGKEKIRIQNRASRDISGLYGRNGISDDGSKAVAVGRSGKAMLPTIKAPRRCPGAPRED